MATRTITHPAVARLLTELAALPAGDPTDQLEPARTAVLAALADPAISQLYQGRTASFLIAGEPGGLAVHASVHRPGHLTPPHDHGPAWAVYGVVVGPTSFTRWDRLADPEPGRAALGPPDQLELTAGSAEVVLPGQVHTVANRTADWTWNLVVRSRLLSEITRSVFDLDTGAYRVLGPSDSPSAGPSERPKARRSHVD
ncbi:MAG TPA: hypothetical protein VHW44_32170 [Pseudonocardiaceae bacterium]|jgi:predicted metal-dependent enzyme (double-stranded beta helix superfamily)|nr:hypothetical protein [Pseudonocardiaceae bacterium]